MPNKCCVMNCNGNYNKQNKEKVFRLPRDKEERERWMKIIPRDNIPDTSNTVICERHFPPNYETVTVFGRKRPRNPPSIFSCVKPSLLPTVPPSPRPSYDKVSSSKRNIKEDELKSFLEKDRINSFESLCEKVSKEKETILDVENIVTYVIDNSLLIIQSTEFFEKTAIPYYLLKIKRDFSFESYHAGVKVTISSLSSNRIIYLNTYSKLQEAIRHLRSMDIDHKKSVLLEQFASMSSITYVGEKKYNAEVIVRAFEYFAVSRCLYSRLRDDFELPSIATLTRLTSKINNAYDDHDYIKNIFKNLKDERHKSCLILIDEVYVKPSLLYHGGSLFGNSVNKPGKLATTILSFMIYSLFGGPKYLCKVLPVYELDSDFLWDQTQLILQILKDSGANVVSIICDNNRVNQSFFKKFSCVEPWLTDNNIYLLYDFVHIMKSVRNNWITEKTQELSFEEEEETLTAKWTDIVNLYNLEKDHTVKLSKLTEVAVHPKPVERQKVSTCLQVFSDETINALKNHPNITYARGTICFLEKFVKLWKILNVKGLNANIRFRDPERAIISSSNDSRLNFLLDIAKMANSMMTEKQGKRQKKLTKDTARALSHTCQGLVDLTKSLLNTTHSFVMLGEFTTDPLEKMFGKLRQGSGGTYFITVQQVLEKVKIQKAKLCLQLDIDIQKLNAEPGHSCCFCGYIMDENAAEVFENLPNLEPSLPDDIKMSLVYIAGYLCRHDEESSDTKVYYSLYGNFTDSINRGGLAIPSDSACQFCIFSYIMFHEIVNKTCRKSLTNVLMSISECYALNMERKHGNIFSNILFNNHSKLFCPRSTKEPKQKVLKLSN